MARKHFLCVDLISPKTKEEETCYLANMDLRALYKYTAFCDDADKMLKNLRYQDDHIEELIRNNLSKELNRDTFYLKEYDNDFSSPFKVLYNADEDALYINPSELSKIIRTQFKIYDFQFFKKEYTKNQEKIYNFLMDELQKRKNLKEDRAFIVEEKIHNNFFYKYLANDNSDYIDAYDWEEIGLVDSNITAVVNYLAGNLHTKVILAMIIKKALNAKSLISKDAINKRRAVWNKKFKEEEKCYKFVNEQISSNVKKFFK